MARPSPRPRFSLVSKLDPVQIRKRINATIQSSERLRGFASDERIEIAIAGPEHHFWSPQLVVRMSRVASRSGESGSESGSGEPGSESGSGEPGSESGSGEPGSESSSVESSAAGGTLLEARFGPDPYVWALYLLTYATLLLLTFWAILFGFAQWWLSMTPTALLAAPLLGGLAALVYGASYVGQGLGSDQMFLLRATVMRLCDCHDPSLGVEPIVAPALDEDRERADEVVSA